MARGRQLVPSLAVIKWQSKLNPRTRWTSLDYRHRFQTSIDHIFCHIMGFPQRLVNIQVRLVVQDDACLYLQIQQQPRPSLSRHLQIGNHMNVTLHL